MMIIVERVSEDKLICQSWTFTLLNDVELALDRYFYQTRPTTHGVE